MTDATHASFYPPLEERINIGSHALGLIFSSVALMFLIPKAISHGGAAPVLSFTIFGISMITLYAASTVYHSAKDPAHRVRMRVVDHASIYVLIAGSYTPFTLVTLEGMTGWIMFALVWTMAITGIVLKLYFTGRYNLLSTLMYLLMGWLIVFAIKPLIANLGDGGIFWLAAGGLSYTLGAILYSIKRLHFNHALFHLFVLAGTICHFVCVYYFVVPLRP